VNPTAGTGEEQPEVHAEPTAESTVDTTAQEALQPSEKNITAVVEPHAFQDQPQMSQYDYNGLFTENGAWGEEDYYQDKITRQLESPVPSEKSEGFRFLPLLTGTEEKLDLYLTEALSDDDVAVPRQTVAAKREEAVTPILRPTTPTQPTAKEDSAEDHLLGEENDGLMEEHEDDAQVHKPDEAERESTLEDTIDRDALIANIKAGLETKDKLSAINLILQGKLSDHFRKKRVNCVSFAPPQLFITNGCCQGR
jgi:hypothetical protein